MKHVKTFENDNNNIFDTYYDFYILKNGKEEKIVINRDFYKYNNYDLDSMIDVYIKLKGETRDITIKKVTVENIDLTKVPSYVMKKDVKNYNL